jgi:hypothetical protein
MDPATIQNDIADKVGVDAEIATKLQEMVTASRNTIRDEFRNGTPPDQIQTNIQAERQKLLTQAGTLLTPDQTQKFQDWLEAQLTRQRRPSSAPGAPFPGDGSATASDPKGN